MSKKIAHMGFLTLSSYILSNRLELGCESWKSLTFISPNSNPTREGCGNGWTHKASPDFGFNTIIIIKRKSKIIPPCQPNFFSFIFIIFNLQISIKKTPISIKTRHHLIKYILYREQVGRQSHLCETIYQFNHADILRKKRDKLVQRCELPSHASHHPTNYFVSFLYLFLGWEKPKMQIQKSFKASPI